MRIRRKLLLGAAFVAVLGIAGPLMGQAIDDVVEGVEIDGNIRFDGTETGALLDWAVDNDGDSTGCIIPDDGSRPPIADYGGNCGGEPDATFVVDQTTQGGNKDVNVFDAGKEDAPAGWTFKKGDAPAKDDIGNVYAWKQEAASGDTIMYAAFERRVNNGDTHLDFELNQVTRLCPYSPGGGQPLGTIACPDRKAGDFILSFNLGPVTGGDFSDAVIQLFQIVADGPDPDSQGDLDLTPLFSIDISDPADIASLADGLDISGDIPDAICGGTPCPANTLVIGVNSGGSIPAGPWKSAQGNAANQTSVQVANFFEAAIDLDNIGRGPSCPGAASLTIKSRSSSSITSDLKDTTLPVPFDLTNCGKIIIQKLTQGADVGTFNYTSDPDLPGTTAPLGSFSITTADDPSPTLPPPTHDGFGSATFNQIVPGTYTVTESAPSGFSFDSAACVDDSDGGSNNVNSSSTAGAVATIKVDANEEVTCTYINVQPKLQVTKQIVNSCTTDTGTFQMKVDGASFGSPIGGGATAGPLPLSPGSHTVSEAGAGTTVLSNYESAIGGADCNPDGSGSVTLSNGNTSSCTITNTRKAKVTVQKVVTGGPGSFNLFIDDDVAAAVQVGTNVGDFTSAATLVSPGTVVVSEEEGTGTDFANFHTFISCDDGNATTAQPTDGTTRSVSIAVNSGEDVKCVIYNNFVQQSAACSP